MMPTKKEGVNYLKEVLSGFRAPDDISIPDWVEKNVKLPTFTSNEPGPLRISRTPYTRGPLEALQNNYIEWVVLVWGRQLGKSQGVIYPFICYCIAEDPGPAICLLPTIDKAKYTSKKRLQPMFDICEPVRQKKTENPDDYSILEMQFRDMAVSMAWGGSKSQLTTRPARYLLRDEIDELKKNVGEGGLDPMKAIEQTTSNFSNRKLLDASTPTLPEGNAWTELKTCQKVFEFWIPCPHCGVIQILYWENIKFGDSFDPQIVEMNAYYECEACHERVSNLEKIRMLGKGEWRARNISDPVDQIMKNIKATIEETTSLQDVLKDRSIKKIGFHLPKWYSPFSGGTFGIIAKEFLEANKILQEGEDFAPMRNWRIYNAAKPWQEAGPTPSEIELLENRIDIPPMVCPDETIAITVGIDPSEGGFYFSTLAWLRDPEKGVLSGHLLQYGILYEWESLQNYLADSIFPCKKERKWRIWIAGLDTGGGELEAADTTMTEAAYIWLRRMRQLGINVFGTKGISHSSHNRVKQGKIEKMPGRQGAPIPGGLILWEINTLAMKDVLWYHLKLPAGSPGRFTFHSETDLDYLKQILSEKKEMQRSGKFEWKKRGKNHWLDATLIAFALVEPECFGLQVTGTARRAGQQRRFISKGVEL
jgi:phage terminase large subunit GpA-like protein